MAVSFLVISITVCVCLGVSRRECRSLNYSNERTLNFVLVDVDVSASLQGEFYEENSSLQVGETFF